MRLVRVKRAGPARRALRQQTYKRRLLSGGRYVKAALPSWRKNLESNCKEVIPPAEAVPFLI